MGWLDWFIDLVLHDAHAVYGGWLVERDGRAVALLTDPKCVDMFWYAWRIEPLSDDESEQGELLTQSYWSPENARRTVYRSRDFGCVAPNAFPGGPAIRDGRLLMRGLYQPQRRRIKLGVER